VCISHSTEPLSHLKQCPQKLEFNTNTGGLCSDVVGISRGHRVNKMKGVAKYRWFTLACSSVIQASSKSTGLSRTFPFFTPLLITQRWRMVDDSLPVSAPTFPLVFKQIPNNKRYVAKLLIDTARRRWFWERKC